MMTMSRSLYGSETWTLYERIDGQTQTSEVMFLRSVFGREFGETG